MLNPKFGSWNKKNKNKNMTNARQGFNKILLLEWNKNKIKAMIEKYTQN
jgi:hypothetical protein